MRKILLWLTSLRAWKKKQTDENFFHKSNKMIAVSYIVKRKIKKIFFEVISNSKIFNIIFFQRNCQRPRFSQTYRGTRQREDWTASNTVIPTDRYQRVNNKEFFSIFFKKFLFYSNQVELRIFVHLVIKNLQLKEN